MTAGKDRYSYYLPVEIAAAIKEIALSRKVSASDVAAEFLEFGVRQNLESAGMTILLPELELMFKTELAKAVERMVRLQVRGTLEAMTNRRILTNFMHKSGIDRKIVAEINEASYQASLRSLKTPLEDLREIIDAAERSSHL